MRAIKQNILVVALGVMTTALLFSLAGCGGSSTTTAATASTGTVNPDGTAITTAPAISLALVDTTGAAVTSISNGSPATVKATLLDANGAVVPNAVVTFTTDETIAAITPTGGTALTDATGVASVTLTPASITAAGASTITATAQVGTAAVTNSTGYSVGATTVTMTAPSLGAGSTAAAALSAFGTTSVTVTVSSGGVPITSPQVVTFTSTCAGSGKAVLTASATTVNGVAIGSYRDNGCAGSDVITAAVGSLTTPQSTTIYVTAPTAGSIQYVSATPKSIKLAGTGGASSSQVAFKVVDGGGNPISGKDVTFGLSTTAGGITLTPAAPSVATSDSAGMVYVNVNAGKVSTPVRVTASTPGAGTSILTTQSSELTISTGIPVQQSFALSATTYNIEGWEYDGVTTVLTARMADHFGNHVDDGTAVNFISLEGGRIVASCVSNNSSPTPLVPSNANCVEISTTSPVPVTQVLFNSQNMRPADGRLTILAYTIGEEGFRDLNGNGVADKSLSAPFGATELIDVNNNSTDMPEAWVDFNEDGVYQPATEPFIDFNNNNQYDVADGKFNGVLCDNVSAPPVGSSAGTCGASKTIHVRDSIVIVLSGSTPTITTNVATLTTYNAGTATVNLDPTLGTNGCGGPQTIKVKIVDARGNLMPAGTNVSFATNGDGIVVSKTGNFPVENANTPVASIPAYNYSVTIKGDGSRDATSGACTDTTFNGTLDVTVTTPKGNSTTYTIANLIN